MANRKSRHRAMREAAERARSKSDEQPAYDEPDAPLEHTLGSSSGLPEEIECPDCAEVIKARAKVCRFCGAEIASPKQRAKRRASSGRVKRSGGGGSRVVHHHHHSSVSPGAAAVLSAFVPGLGQLYAGQLTKGVLMLLLGAPIAIVVGFFTLGLGYLAYIVWAVFDAYSSATSANRRAAGGRW